MSHLTSMEITVMLPAGQIPLGETVTKRTGRKEYVLKDRMRIFSPNVEDRQEVVAQPGVLFLVNDGDANAIPADTLLMWKTTGQYLVDHLRHGLDPYRDSGK